MKINLISEQLYENKKKKALKWFSLNHAKQKFDKKSKSLDLLIRILNWR